MIFFHNPEEENGYLSNWYLSKFCVNGIAFSSMEQYMMYVKADLFKDSVIAAEILKTDDVAEIKSLGRKVHNFDDKTWDECKYDLIKTGIEQKFVQNPELLKKLLDTGNSLIAECAVKDTIWGIGLSMKDDRRMNQSQWRGQNLLGKALMEVRDALK